MFDAPRGSVVWQLTRDTFRQARASGVGLMMLGVTAVCAALCLSVGVAGDVALRAGDEPSFFLPPTSARAVASLEAANPSRPTVMEADPAFARREGVETIGGRVSLAFGAVSFPVGRDRGEAVRFLELVLAWGVAGTLGLLLALVWTAGFLPTFLEPNAASALLTRPVGRRDLLLGKYLGALAFVGAHAALFVLLTWLALGVRTGAWDAAYWWCVPLLVVQFAAYYSFSALLAVVTRSTAACAFGSALYWLLSWGINYGRAMARALPEGHSLPRGTLASVEAAYLASPKPIDAGLILFRALDAGRHFDMPAAFQALEAGAGFSPSLSVLSSLAVAVVLLAIAAHEFAATDY